MARLNAGDKFLVNRNSTSYQFEAVNTMAEIQENDLMLVNRSGTSYKITGLDVVDSLKQKQPTLYRTAKGAISDGHTVCLNDDNTVSEVTGSDGSATLGDIDFFKAGGGVQNIGYDPVRDKYLFVWIGANNATYYAVFDRDSNGNYTKVGSDQTLYSAASSQCSLCYIPEYGLFFVGFVYGGNLTYDCYPIKINADGSTTRGTRRNIDPGGNNNWVWTRPDVIWDPNSERVLCVYTKYFLDGALSRGRPIIRAAALRYDPVKDGFYDYVYFDVDQQSPTDTSINRPGVTYDSNNNRVFIGYPVDEDGSGQTFFGCVGRLSANGNSSTFDYTARQALTPSSNKVQAGQAVYPAYYDPDSGIVGYFFNINDPNNGLDYSGAYGIYKLNSSNNNIEILTELIIYNELKTEAVVVGYDYLRKTGVHFRRTYPTSYYRGFAFAPSINRFILEDEQDHPGVPYQNVSNFAFNPSVSTNTHTFSSSGVNTDAGQQGAYVTEFIPDTFLSNANANNFVGFSNGSYSDGEEADIHTHMAINEAQSGLVAGEQYFLRGDGSIDTSPANNTTIIKAGIGISSTKIQVKLN